MTLADDLLAPSEVAFHRGQTCNVRLLLAELDANDPDAGAALRVALDSPRLPSTVLSQRLTAGGYLIRPSSLQRHRRRECACPT